MKPGTVHRLVKDKSYEVRLAEVIVASRYLEEAYSRGRRLAEGRLDARGVRLGSLFAQAVRDVFDFTGERPVAGLIFAGLASTLVAGYSSATGRDPLEDYRRLSRTLAYQTGGEDTVEFIEGLESVGYSEAVLRLDAHGLTKRHVSLEDTPLGEVLEKINDVDTGFSFNLRGSQLIMGVWRSVRSSKSLVELVLRSFYELGVRTGRLPEARGNSIFRHLLSLEGRIERGATDALLGGTAYLAVLGNVTRGLPPVA